MCSQRTWSCVSSAPKVLHLAPQHPALCSGPALPFSWRGWAELLHRPPGCLLTGPPPGEGALELPGQEQRALHRVRPQLRTHWLWGLGQVTGFPSAPVSWSVKRT